MVCVEIFDRKTQGNPSKHGCNFGKSFWHRRYRMKKKKYTEIRWFHFRGDKINPGCGGHETREKAKRNSYMDGNDLRRVELREI